MVGSCRGPADEDETGTARPSSKSLSPSRHPAVLRGCQTEADRSRQQRRHQPPHRRVRSGLPVAALREGLKLSRPVTFLVGENGSGKSTLIEAIAEAFGLDARGGRAGRKYANNRPRTPLGEVMRLDLTREGARMRGGPRAKRKGYFLRAEAAFGFAEAVSGMHGYWQEDLTERSHGEGFMVIFDSMFREPGLYLMDEPEAALSFTSCLQLVALMHQLGQSGAQVICATHSPILAATPGADIVEIGDHGFRRIEWADLDLVDHWRRYLASPEAYLRRIIEPTESR